MGRTAPKKSRINPAEAQDLFLNLAEQVKQPLVQISYAAELMESQADPALAEASRRSIAVTSQAALHLIDSYLLNVQLQREHELALEPVSLSSVLYDTAATLDDFAHAHGCKLELMVAGKYGPVMGHRAAIQAALTSLGYSFIEALSNEEGATIHLAVRRNNKGIAAGIFSARANLSEALLQRARVLKGRVHQPFGGFDSSNGSGILVADALFTRMDTSMRVARLQNMQGLAATLAPSRQLSLV